MTELLTSSSETLTDSQIDEQVAHFAGNAYKEGVNPVDLFDIENDIEGLGEVDVQRTDVEPTILEIRDKLEGALASKVLARGESAHGTVSRAREASPDDILEVAVEFYKSALISSRYEKLDSK